MRCICVTWASGTSWRGRALLERVENWIVRDSSTTMTAEDIVDTIFEQVSRTALNACFASNPKYMGARDTATCVIYIKTLVPVDREERSKKQDPDSTGGVVRSRMHKQMSDTSGGAHVGKCDPDIAESSLCPDERLRAEIFFFGAPGRVERRGKAHGVKSLLQTAKSLHNSLSNPAPPVILYCHFLHIPGPHLQRLFYMYLHFRSPSNFTTSPYRQCIATDVLSSLNGAKNKKKNVCWSTSALPRATGDVHGWGRLGVRVSHRAWFRGVMRCICVTWASGTSWRGRALSKPLAPGTWMERSAAQIFQPTLFRYGAWITAPHSAVCVRFHVGMVQAGSCWTGHNSLWRVVASFLSYWCAGGDVPTGVKIKPYTCLGPERLFGRNWYRMRRSRGLRPSSGFVHAVRSRLEPL